MKTIKIAAGTKLITTWNGQGSRRFVLGEGARLKLFQIFLGDENVDSEATVELKGDFSEALTQTLFFGRGRQTQNMKVVHVHEGKNTKSLLISKGAVSDEAKNSFYGNIKMNDSCQGSTGRLEEHNLILSSGAKIDAIPALEIHCDEIQASHSATLERVDEEKLFYLKSRGLSEAESLRLLVEGFFVDALDKMENPRLQKKVLDALLSRLTC